MTTNTTYDYDNGTIACEYEAPGFYLLFEKEVSDFTGFLLETGEAQDIDSDGLLVVVGYTPDGEDEWIATVSVADWLDRNTTNYAETLPEWVAFKKLAAVSLRAAEAA